MKKNNCEDYVKNFIKIFNISLDEKRYEDLLLNFVYIFDITQPLILYSLSSDIGISGVYNA
ncbi:hypothetical protein ONB71_01515 [Candidatus Purcelliella pentastirinorum]|uniref:Uncharacterized protein n=1 Tax=Candidatus Purcelliella pentastirinorum TaxID=472834 RepID=A0AAX3N8P2_9ENTR|nr:hypothetical protein [Candidatus Purcelliella pentastirinorum]WDI78374.1 hypothetical protein ONB71_01515 [Candidatus Purcelliella pentastirinorum]WDR80599.1 hypothetical protein ONB70_00400 [Candidatus Purcelliella pentastirinorum]